MHSYTSIQKLQKRIALTLCSVFALAAFAAAATVPQSGHVVVVMEENAGYSSVVGNSAMPYLNSLASKYGLATKYYANTHPSIGNYFMLTTGQIITNNDSYASTTSVDNLVRHMIQNGVTWKSYAESLPSVGYTGGNTGGYLRRHNPFSYFSDVANSSNQKDNLVPFTQFAADLANGRLPQFSFVVPNKYDDAHDCPQGSSSCSESTKLAAADKWLKNNIAPLLANADFQKDGLLIIATDEADSGDSTKGGGRVAVLMAGPNVNNGYKATGTYQHQNLLKTISQALGLSSTPGAGSAAAAMTEFFGGSSTPPPPPPPPPSGGGSCAAPSSGVTVCAPQTGASSGSPVAILAAAASNIATMKVYVDGVSKYTGAGNGINTSLAMGSGSHRITVKGWTSSGTVYAAPSMTVSVP